MKLHLNYFSIWPCLGSGWTIPSSFWPRGLCLALTTSWQIFIFYWASEGPTSQRPLNILAYECWKCIFLGHHLTKTGCLYVIIFCGELLCQAQTIKCVKDCQKSALLVLWWNMKFRNRWTHSLTRMMTVWSCEWCPCHFSLVLPPLFRIGNGVRTWDMDLGPVRSGIENWRQGNERDFLVGFGRSF